MGSFETNSLQVTRQLRALKGNLARDRVRITNRSAEATREEMGKAILARRTISGGTRPALDKATIKAKSKRRPGKRPSTTPTIPLSDQGIMRNVNIKPATLSNPVATLTPPKSRLAPAQVHQDNKFGRWFGVTQNAVARSRVLVGQGFRATIQRFNSGR